MAKAVFLQGALMRHVAVMSLTSSVGLMAIFAVDFVDMIFISMLGNKALAAAVGYAGTLLFFTNAFNIGLSISAGSLVARAIGADQPDRAREYAASVAVLGVLMGLVLPLVVLGNLAPILSWLGAEGDTLALAQRYVRIVIPTMPLMSLAMVGMAVLRAHGDARRSMMGTVFGGAVNAALDPLLIFGLGLGLDGAAYASVMARIVMCSYAVVSVWRVHNGFARPALPVLMRDARAIAAIAAPAILTNVASPVGNAIVTREVAVYGTDAVAAMAVIGRLMPVAFAVVFALSGAIGPIVGQNFGAGLFARVRGTLVAGLQFLLGYTLLAALILFVARQMIADVFEASGEMRTLIYLFCGPLALMQFFNGVIFVCNACFNNLGHPIYSTYVNWGRHSLGTYPFVIAGGAIWGASGVLMGQAVGGAFFALAALLLAMKTIRKISAPEPVDPFAKDSTLHHVSGRRNW
ncbi:MATE family efflux transporter [Shimia sp. R11_0]|uniref:MATE family efflux transporter n=1 Tax=Shimia sp. R11_0 TaxID=2821096 RepID=UPI001FFDFEDA|nr:MATE family efflux transporter [Shimia sp. R11_0]